MSRTLSILSAAVVVSALSASGAFAHAHLKSAQPAENAAVASPDELDLTFSEELNLKFSGLTLAGPEKAPVRTGEGTLTDDGKTLMVPVAGKLAPGAYEVRWHVLSADGHKTKGSYRFTVKP